VGRNSGHLAFLNDFHNTPDRINRKVIQRFELAYLVYFKGADIAPVIHFQVIPAINVQQALTPYTEIPDRQVFGLYCLSIIENIKIALVILVSSKLLRRKGETHGLQRRAIKYYAR
jgi:hypothetical protein